jgi:hypothetical protein
MCQSPYQKEETEDLLKQVNELRILLALCWSILPDDDYGKDAVKIKEGMTKYKCWP